MSLVQYYNLLMFQSTDTVMEVIGEDASVSDFASNPAEDGMTATETDEYRQKLAGIETLRIKYLGTTRLPPGTFFTGLRHIEMNNCTNILQIPTTYPAELHTIRAGSTKISSIPDVYTSLRLLDVSNCKRISSVGIRTVETLIISHSAVTEITNLDNLVRLVALSTRISLVPVAPTLKVVLWSGIMSGRLTVDPANDQVVQIITPGQESLVTSTHGVVTSITLQ